MWLLKLPWCLFFHYSLLCWDKTYQDYIYIYKTLSVRCGRKRVNEEFAVVSVKQRRTLPVFIEFKRYKGAVCSSRSSAHLHFKPKNPASSTAHCRSASLPPAEFIWGERASHSRGGGRDQEEGRAYCTCVKSCLVDGMVRKHLKHGRKCHILAKRVFIQTHAAPLTLAHTLGLPQKYFSSLHSARPQFYSYLLEPDWTLKVNFIDKSFMIVHWTRTAAKNRMYITQIF